MRVTSISLAKFILCLCIVGCSSLTFAQRKAGWATPVEAKYIENFYKVDEGVYRSGQPTADAFKELEQMGVKEVLNLRNYHSDENEAEGTKLKLHRVEMKASKSDWNQLVEAVRILKNRKGPIVIHCWHGSDRTGLVVALYRIVFQNWTKEEALDELVNGNYGYHAVYGNIQTFLRGLDVEEFKKDVNS